MKITKTAFNIQEYVKGELTKMLSYSPSLGIWHILRGIQFYKELCDAGFVVEVGLTSLNTIKFSYENVIDGNFDVTMTAIGEFTLVKRGQIIANSMTSQVIITKIPK